MMPDYYDKNQFTGGRTPPPKPPKKNGGEGGWISWPIIIVLFAIGAWPFALVLMFFNIFGEEAKKAAPGAAAKAQEAAAKAQAAAEQAAARAREAAQAAHAAGPRKSAAQESMEKARAARNGQPGHITDPEALAEEFTRAAERQSAQRPARKTSGKAAKTVKPTVKKQKLPGKALRVLGIIFLAIGALVGMSFLADVLQGFWVDFDDFFASVGFLASGGIMWGRGQYLARMTRRSQRYILAIGGADTMPIEEIAKRVNRTPDKAARELQKLIDKGYLGDDAYIDRERGYFLRFGATVSEPEAERAPQPAPKEAEEGYSGILRNIRRANDRIADEELSRKIDRLEQVTGLIFREVEEHPEKRERIRTFFDYYLPTTQKLLDAYAEFEETGVDGEHLREAKERIEQTMDAIVEGFEHQLDQLYSVDAMDVVSDIKVMETMLYRDTASVAKDFGFAPEEKSGRKAAARTAPAQPELRTEPSQPPEQKPDDPDKPIQLEL